MAVGIFTGMDAVRREDLVDYITNVDFKNTPLYSGLGTTEAKNTFHEWATDVFASAADNAVIEGADATVVDHVSPVRKNNIVQMFRKVITVTDTEKAVNTLMGDPYAYQLKKGTMELARDIENCLVAGTRASGTTNAARRLDGVIAQISSFKTAQTSGTSLSETQFNNILQGIFDQGTDEVASEVYVGSYLKRAISGYTAGATVQVMQEDKRRWNTVGFYESDFGPVNIYLNRFVPAGSVLAVRPEYFKVAYLTGRRPQHIPLSKTGSSTKGMVEGELTLEALAEKTSAYASGWYRG
jgi:hypothetical protein